MEGNAIHFGTLSAGVSYSGSIFGHRMTGTYQTPLAGKGSSGGGSWSATKSS